jgi:hypothetical protein
MKDFLVAWRTSLHRENMPDVIQISFGKVNPKFPEKPFFIFYLSIESAITLFGEKINEIKEEHTYYKVQLDLSGVDKWMI